MSEGRHRLVGAALGSLLALAALAPAQPSRAGDLAEQLVSDPQERLITAQSIWSEADAIQRARAQLPRGVVVTHTRCTVVNVTMGNDRYICTLTYRPAPAAADPAAPAP